MENILFKVSSCGEMQSFRGVLGVGNYINVISVEEGHALFMLERSQFRFTKALAWIKHAESISRDIQTARLMAVKGQRTLHMLRRIQVEYSRKKEEYAEAFHRARTWLLELGSLIDQRKQALKNAEDD